MQKIISIFFTLIISSFALAQQELQPQVYEGIKQLQKKTLFFDDFSKNDNFWAPLPKQGNSIKFENGQLYLISESDKISETVDVDINENENFEIETEIKFIKGNQGRAFGLQWGRSKTGDRYFSFIINAKQQFAISKFSGAYILYTRSAHSDLIKPNDYNKLTIRKFDNMLYFFINETLVYSMEYKLFYGKAVGFQTSGGNTVAADYLKINTITDAPVNNPPEIVFISPETTNSFLEIDADKTSLRIKGIVLDEQKISTITINDKKYPLADDASFNIPIDIRNIDAIKVSVTDNQLQTSTEYINLLRPNTSNNKDSSVIIGSYYALIIGVSDYSSEDVPDLDAPVHDAEKIKNILVNNYTFPPENIYFLQNPKREDLIIAFDKLTNKLTPEDNLLIFYAGHGYWDPQRKLGFWLPSDASLSSSANWFRNSTLKSYIASINARNILLISDACFSGSIFKSRGISVKAPKEIVDLYNLPSRKAMTSGNLKEVPDVSQFLKYLTKRLSENKEKFITAEDLFNSLKQAVMNNTENVPQFGTIRNSGDEGGSFVFIKR